MPLDRAYPYRIDFENDAVATAPAQRVDVTDQLASTLLSHEVLERQDIDRIMGKLPRAPSRIGELSVAAATAVHPATPRPRQHK